MESRTLLIVCLAVVVLAAAAFLALSPAPHPPRLLATSPVISPFSL